MTRARASRAAHLDRVDLLQLRHEVRDVVAHALAALRERHGKALLRYVDDDADCLRAVAADPRLFSLQLFFASWGYATEEQRSNVAAMPRVREPRLELLCLHWP